MIDFTFKKRVRYGETDQMGYLYYGHYAAYYEIGRTEFIRSTGLSYKEMEETHRVMMPVTTLNQRFVRPARYDEEISIRTMVKAMPDRYIYFDMELRNEAGKLVSAGQVRLCFVDMDTNKAVPAPDFFMP